MKLYKCHHCVQFISFFIMVRRFRPFFHHGEAASICTDIMTSKLVMLGMHFCILGSSGVLWSAAQHNVVFVFCNQYTAVATEATRSSRVVALEFMEVSKAGGCR